MYFLLLIFFVVEFIFCNQHINACDDGCSYCTEMTSTARKTQTPKWRKTCDSYVLHFCSAHFLLLFELQNDFECQELLNQCTFYDATCSKFWNACSHPQKNALTHNLQAAVRLNKTQRITLRSTFSLVYFRQRQATEACQDQKKSRSYPLFGAGWQVIHRPVVTRAKSVGKLTDTTSKSGSRSSCLVCTRIRLCVFAPA